MADQRFNLSVLFNVIDQASGPLRKAGASFNKLGRNVQKIASPLRRMASALGLLKNDLRIAEVKTNRFRDSILKASAAIDTKLKNGLMTIGRFAPLALAAFAASAVRTRIKFETSMNKVAAITGATGETFARLEGQARKLGSTTQFSASQAAEAMTFLGMAGLNAEQVMKTLPGTLQLAAAGGLDLAAAADLVTNVMTSMGKKVEDISKINDILAKTAATANTDVMQLGEAFRPVAGFASSAGVSVAHLSALLGKMADSGERGSIAGTLLRQSFNELLKNGPKMQAFLSELGLNINQFTDEQGKLKNFGELMKEIGKKGVAPAKVMRAFGRQGGRAVLLLSKKGKDIKEFTKTLEESEGSAQKMADTMMRGLPGAAKTLSSAFEAFQLSFSETDGFLEMVTLQLAAFFQSLADGESIIDSLAAAMEAGNDIFKKWLEGMAGGIKDFFGIERVEVQGRLTGDELEAFEKAKREDEQAGLNSSTNVSEVIGDASRRTESETVVKVLVQSTSDSEASVEGVQRKKGSAKTIVKNTTLLTPFLTSGGHKI